MIGNPGIGMGKKWPELQFRFVSLCVDVDVDVDVCVCPLLQLNKEYCATASVFCQASTS